MRHLPALPVLALALAVAACDSGSSTDPDDLLGTWDLDAQAFASYVVLSETQTGVDLSRPGTGAVTVTGDLSASLRYLQSRFANDDGQTISVGLTDVSASQSTPDRLTLSLQSNIAVLTVTDEAGAVVQTFIPEDFSDPNLVTFDADGVEITPIRLVDSASGDEVTVRGSLIYPRTTYAAGESAPVYRGVSGSATFIGDRRITFEAGADGAEGGDFLGIAAGTAAVSTGTWTPVGDDQVQIRARSEGEPAETTTYTYEVNGSTLVLRSEDVDGCNALCARSVEATLGVEAGTLDEYRVETTSTYVRAGAGDVRVAAGRP